MFLKYDQISIAWISSIKNECKAHISLVPLHVQKYWNVYFVIDVPWLSIKSEWFAQIDQTRVKWVCSFHFWIITFLCSKCIWTTATLHFHFKILCSKSLHLRSWDVWSFCLINDLKYKLSIKYMVKYLTNCFLFQRLHLFWVQSRFQRSHLFWG